MSLWKKEENRKESDWRIRKVASKPEEDKGYPVDVDVAGTGSTYNKRF